MKKLYENFFYLLLYFGFAIQPNNFKHNGSNKVINFKTKCEKKINAPQKRSDYYSYNSCIKSQNIKKISPSDQPDDKNSISNILKWFVTGVIVTMFIVSIAIITISILTKYCLNCGKNTIIRGSNNFFADKKITDNYEMKCCADPKPKEDIEKVKVDKQHSDKVKDEELISSWKSMDKDLVLHNIKYGKILRQKECVINELRRYKENLRLNRIQQVAVYKKIEELNTKIELHILIEENYNEFRNLFYLLLNNSEYNSLSNVINKRLAEILKIESGADFLDYKPFIENADYIKKIIEIASEAEILNNIQYISDINSFCEQELNHWILENTRLKLETITTKNIELESAIENENYICILIKKISTLNSNLEMLLKESDNISNTVYSIRCSMFQTSLDITSTRLKLHW